jgi:hypothetical protein
MAIKDLKNITEINLRQDTKGQLIESADLNIFKSSAAVTNQFGISKNDVIEFRLYDKSNNLLTQLQNKKVRYIKPNEFNDYLTTSVDSNGEKTYSVNVEKLIIDSGNGEGEYKISLNFVKNKLGTDNNVEKVWIEEISPSRKEIRILPLLKDGSLYNDKIKNRYLGFTKNYSEIRTNLDKVVKKIDSVELQVSNIIDEYFSSKYGITYVDTIKKDFGIGNNWGNFKSQILKDFKESLIYQTQGRSYKLGAANYGLESYQQFDLDEFSEFTPYIIDRLRDSIEYNMRNLREVKFSPNVQSTINDSEEVKLLETLIEKPFVSKTTIAGTDIVEKKEINSNLAQLIGNNTKSDVEPVIKTIDPITGKEQIVKNITPESVLEKVSDVKQYSQNPNNPSPAPTNPSRTGILNTINDVKGQIDNTKKQIADAVNKANELKGKATAAVGQAKDAINKIQNLKGEIAGKADALKGQADALKGQAAAAIGQAKGAVDKVKGLLAKKPKKKIGESKFKLPKLF